MTPVLEVVGARDVWETHSQRKFHHSQFGSVRFSFVHAHTAGRIGNDDYASKSDSGIFPVFIIPTNWNSFETS